MEQTTTSHRRAVPESINRRQTDYVTVQAELDAGERG